MKITKLQDETGQLDDVGYNKVHSWNGMSNQELQYESPGCWNAASTEYSKVLS